LSGYICRKAKLMDVTDVKILIADDEPDVLDFLKYTLEREGFWVYTASNGEVAFKLAKEVQPEVIVLDVMMPKMNGIEVCRQLRAIPEFKKTAITFLTARSEDYSEIAGLEAGADDYITKPIRPKIFVSRINALLRRNQEQKNTEVIKVGNLVIDRERYLVISNKKEIDLPRKEFELLHLLVSKPGRLFRREEIMKRVWGDESIVGDRTIDVHIRKIRDKIGDNRIKTVKGVGYKFDG
jgi:two-component system, OmpR family, alkaline phosphatase synthesis response regulator PhoP